MKAVGHDTSRGAPSSGSDHDIVLSGEIDVIPHDQEIVHVAHLADRVELILQSLPERSVVVRIALLHAVFAQLVEIGPGIIALRHLEVREFGDAEFDLDIAALRDAVGVVQRLLGIGKQGPHFHLAFDKKLPARIPHPVLVGELLACLYAQQDIVSFHVIGVGIVDVVGGDQRDPQTPAHGHQRHIHFLLVLISVVLQFQEEITFSENIQILESRFIRRREIVPHDIAGHFSSQTGARSDDPLVELTQKFLVHARLIVIAFRKRAAHDLHEIGIALIVLGEKDQVIIPVVSGSLFPVKSGSGRHIDFTADDGLDPRLFGCFIKIDHAVHDAVIGYGSAVHAKFLDALNIFFDLVGSVQQRVFGVDVQMCKCHPASLSRPFQAAKLLFCLLADLAVVLTVIVFLQVREDRDKVLRRRDLNVAVRRLDELDFAACKGLYDHGVVCDDNAFCAQLDIGMNHLLIRLADHFEFKDLRCLHDPDVLAIGCFDNKSLAV